MVSHVTMFVLLKLASKETIRGRVLRSIGFPKCYFLEIDQLKTTSMAGTQ
ncbi:hypothetical protein F957_01326 [Acinetobacter gyllenbergii CIP 110306 = MTCC 11365]|uniref:Uncharacterized protein n=1 Tax=Acinetobacter gyllenbergii CIP 110306 = MTCC 11365 TaxID=1217657 RepID=A0A829HJ04_9GAMM|nr:hypothetical protein F957_01326 [Acinetobacter gyllenbergii CIP 110306 = MTCC 11365]